MYTIRVEKECSCFKKSGFENNLTFEDKEDAIAKARVMECRMNQEFCFTHAFNAIDKGNEILILSEEQPEDEKEDAEELKSLLRRNAVNVAFDSGENNPQSSGSCGNEHCGEFS